MKFLPLVFTLSIGALSLSISTLQAADLMSVYQEALAQDSQYRSARAAYQATQEKLVQGRAGFFTHHHANRVTHRSRGGRRQLNQFHNEQQHQSCAGHHSKPWRNDNRHATAVPDGNIVIYQQSKTEISRADAQFIIAGQDLICVSPKRILTCWMRKSMSRSPKRKKQPF